ncbi:EamA family transporter RarD [Nostocoides sp. F2B08]|uniref:EamA family transporter RarD n=1 Tax=Nostocoides sp. F2B08 TaxID=2653936 RepID=UPI0012633928|nr:EamA family transporter RarD [Tetrasphaera sp. F2B08]KAB7746419.1 EamA family transporter RarD [Tetrasphaera sp. F2B08]
MITGSDETRRGTGYVFAAYGIWGLFPLYFAAMQPASAWEILAHRIIWSLVFCAGILVIRRDLAWLGGVLRNRRLMLGMVAAALLIATNWGFYVYAVISGQTTEAALGYFLNPLVTVALGVVVLRETLRPPQWVAVGIGAVAAVYLGIQAGTAPVIALILAFSFGLYSLVKKRVGVSLTAMRGLALETAILAPVAAALIAWTTWNGTSTFLTEGTGHTILLASAGVVTAIPLLLFAAAARRVPLTTIGLVQFITPVLQLIVAVTLLGEEMSRARWIGFGIVWIALAVLTVDMLGRRRRLRGLPPATA